MSLGIPCENICHQPFSQGIQAGEVADPESLTLQHAEPLFDLAHPRTMHGQEGTHEAGMGSQPSLNLVHRQGIEHQKEVVDGNRNRPLQLRKEGEMSL